MKIKYIKYTCADCGYEIELYNKDELYISDACGWRVIKSKHVCFVCVAKQRIKKNIEVLESQ
jgi:DNA-directed RNA polymerase subunit RPC12/RpoP